MRLPTWSLVPIAVLSVLGVATWLRPRLPGHVEGPDAATVVDRLREVARLEVLDARLTNHVRWEPDPPPSKSLGADVLEWARATVFPRRAEAIAVGDAHCFLDLRHLDAKSVRRVGDALEVVLPPMQVSVELLPGETRFLHSSLDAAQTGDFLVFARARLQADAERDASLSEQAARSAEAQLRTVLQTFGVSRVIIVKSLVESQLTSPPRS